MTQATTNHTHYPKDECLPKGDRLVVAVDGPAGAGKGAVCRAMAAQFHLTYLETGALYRAVGLIAVNEQIEDALSLAERAKQMPFMFRAVMASTQPASTQPETQPAPVWRAFLGDKDVTNNLRAEAIGQAASRVAAMPEVRAALLTFQRQYGAQDNIILDGRDVGTMVWPDADIKIYLTASLQERAKRRALELQGRGENANLPLIRAQMAERDKRDTERSHAPLKADTNAIQVDTTALTLQQSIAVVASHIETVANPKATNQKQGRGNL